MIGIRYVITVLNTNACSTQTQSSRNLSLTFRKGLYRCVVTQNTTLKSQNVSQKHTATTNLILSALNVVNKQRIPL